MKIVRNKVFETNSSSTHVISITKHEGYKIPKHIDFKFGEFGWSYKVYRDMESKASYLYTLTEYSNRELYLNKIKEYLDEENITYTFEDRKVDSYGWDDNGHIDHGKSNPEIIKEVLESKEKFFRFLFDTRSYVTTGNDNENSFFIPEIGYKYDFCDDTTYTYEKWDKEVEKLKEDNDIYFKDNC